MATLKISDLSVGDWVQNDYGDYVKVEGIWQGCNSNYQVDIFCDGKIATILPCHLHPIPITSEILEKNGFEFEKASRWHICELEDKTRINVWIGRNNEGRIEVSKPDLFDDGYHFKYADIEVLNIAVHQLQHALRLAGVDKEINL
jgi:hypothetical protein